jgi:hypothetical protein
MVKQYQKRISGVGKCKYYESIGTVIGRCPAYRARSPSKFDMDMEMMADELIWEEVEPNYDDFFTEELNFEEED